jgi:hypothetical protein
LAAISRFAARVIPGPVKTASGATVRGIGRGAGWAWRHWWGTLAFALAGAIGSTWRRRRRREFEPAEVGAGTAFRDLTAALTPVGHPRHLHRTPSEYLRELQADAALGGDVIDAAEFVVRTFERERFASSKPSDADVMRARAAAARVRDLIRP